jgi:hypothetical protein
VTCTDLSAKYSEKYLGLEPDDDHTWAEAFKHKGKLAWEFTKATTTTFKKEILYGISKLIGNAIVTTVLGIYGASTALISVVRRLWTLKKAINTE